MAQCPRDGSTLTAAPLDTPLGADSLHCPKCKGASTSKLGSSWFLMDLGLEGSWSELIAQGAVTKSAKPSMVKCPRCATQCSLVTLRGVELDVCSSCEAAWFDGGEVERLKKPGSGDGDGVVGVFEMLWDCEYCGTKALLGASNRHCPSCGAAQDAKRRYFPPDGQEVAANTEFDGADVTCPACKTPNGAKANNCRQCGSPLTEAAKVALVAATGVPKPAPVAPPKPKSRLPLIIGGVGVLLAGFCIVTLAWKKEVKVTVASHSWERVIDIEEKYARNDSAWCDSTPSGAYAVSRKREQHGTKDVTDGQECHNENHDRGNGTFEKRNVCKTKYKSEPVYDDKCYFMVDRWEHARSLKTNGGLTDTPEWPVVRLARTGNSVGDEREGSRHETYRVKLTSSDSKTWDCDKPAAEWKALADGKAYPMKVRRVGGGADCDSLKP